MDFDPVIEAYLSNGANPNVTPLAFFDFRDAPKRVWTGRWTIPNFGGHDWEGVGSVCSIEGLQEAATLEAAEMTFTISGTDEGLGDIMAIARSTDRADYVQRLVTVYLGFFDEDWQPIASPYAVRAGFMGTMEMTKQPVTGDNGQVTGFTRTITLPATNIFAGRGVPRNANWTDRDQQQRSSGDLGLSNIPLLQDFSLREPWR